MFWKTMKLHNYQEEKRRSRKPKSNELEMQSCEKQKIQSMKEKENKRRKRCISHSSVHQKDNDHQQLTFKLPLQWHTIHTRTKKSERKRKDKSKVWLIKKNKNKTLFNSSCWSASLCLSLPRASHTKKLLGYLFYHFMSTCICMISGILNFPCFEILWGANSGSLH